MSFLRRFEMILVAAVLVLSAGVLSMADTGRGLPRAADFTLRDVNPRSDTHGEDLRLRDLYADRGVVLQFTASWCKFCRAELPGLQELHAAGRAPVVLLAADDGGSPDGILRLADSNGITAPILFVPEARAAEFARMYPYRVLPATYLIDSEGVIRAHHQGATPAAELSKAIEEELGR